MRNSWLMSGGCGRRASERRVAFDRGAYSLRRSSGGQPAARWISERFIPEHQIVGRATDGDRCSERVCKANSSSRICRLSSAATPSMRVVKPSLTNSARQPVSGCVRTTRCHLLHLRQLGRAQRRAPVSFLLQLAVLDQIGNAPRAGYRPPRAMRAQRVLGAMHIGKQRIAADGGQFLRMQQRTQAGQRLIRDIRMPVFAGVAQADRRAVLDDVGHHQDFGLCAVELMQHMDHQAAKRRLKSMCCRGVMRWSRNTTR